MGDHEITVKVNGVEVNGSPFTCRAYDPAKIVVGAIPDGVVNKPVHFVGKHVSYALVLFYGCFNFFLFQWTPVKQELATLR